MSEIEAGILIGGKSKRFGQDKAALRFGEFSLLERIFYVLKEVLETVWIIGKSKDNHDLPPDIFIEDIVTNTGPMGGLLTILKKTEKPTLLVSCDTPFIEPEHVQYLLEQFDPKLAGTIALSVKGTEPLFGIYQPQVVKLLEKFIAKSEFALYRIFEYEEVKFVDFSKTGYISHLFFNINTLSDYKKALYLREEIENKKLNSAGGKNG
jgi:molybdopterin-guanine dinucleotide biosynthesis protein A